MELEDAESVREDLKDLRSDGMVLRLYWELEEEAIELEMW